MLNFDILENGLGIISPQHFVFDFPRKLFTLLTDQVSLPDCLYFMRY